ncbi:MAG: hypothetical protein Fur0037_15580 [Planctomycetota bacterium]
MKPLATADALARGKDPCLQIQVDLSAMLDGELDAASVRRVMVHSDVCGSCREFLESIRTQARAHRSLADTGLIGGGPARNSADALRRQLVENQKILGRILYELGRGFILMGLSADFSREVSREPVPVPDMAQKGRNFLDEFERWAEGAGEVGDCTPWVAAKDLFSQSRLSTPAESLAKGQRLLSECLALLDDHHEARIYLGLVHHVRGQRGLARKQFSLVLTGTGDLAMRGFALLNLANVHIDEGDFGGAIDLLQQLVASGVIRKNPRFGMAYFNLALACGLSGRFAEAQTWFQRLHDELPHKRAMVARELTRRIQFVHLLRCHPEVEGQFARDFPAWFPVRFRGAS